jgi:DNA invertase Pin-like site-specific DNA recombinase
MRVGYARVSARDQNIEAQVARLAQCERVFAEKESGAKAGRPELAACLTFVREGDTLVVTRLDRLARSVAHLCSIAATLKDKGVALVVLDQQIDTTTAPGRLFFHMVAAFAEFELDIRKDAQRAGIAHARAKGKTTGRPPTLNADQIRRVQVLHACGVPALAIAREYRVSKSTIRRYVQGAVHSEPT